MPRRQQDTGEPGVRQDTGSGVVELVGDPGRPRAWTLLVDGTPQSHVDLDDPARPAACGAGPADRS